MVASTKLGLLGSALACVGALGAVSTSAQTAASDTGTPKPTEAASIAPEGALLIGRPVLGAPPNTAAASLPSLQAHNQPAGASKRSTVFQRCPDIADVRELDLIVVCAGNSPSQRYRLDFDIVTAAKIGPISDRGALLRIDIDGGGHCGIVGSTRCSEGYIPVSAIAAKAVEVAILIVKGEDWRGAFPSGPTEYERYRAMEPNRSRAALDASLA